MLYPPPGTRWALSEFYRSRATTVPRRSVRRLVPPRGTYRSGRSSLVLPVLPSEGLAIETAGVIPQALAGRSHSTVLRALAFCHFRTWGGVTFKPSQQLAASQLRDLRAFSHENSIAFDSGRLLASVSSNQEPTLCSAALSVHGPGHVCVVP